VFDKASGRSAIMDSRSFVEIKLISLNGGGLWAACPILCLFVFTYFVRFGSDAFCFRFVRFFAFLFVLC
jgi:hypothetical protein